MARTVPPFKFVATEEAMTAQSGLVLFGEGWQRPPIARA